MAEQEEELTISDDAVVAKYNTVGGIVNSK